VVGLQQMPVTYVCTTKFGSLTTGPEEAET